MTYGAKESNSKEAAGLALLVLGLMALSAGWAYGTAFIQIILVLAGIVGIIGSFAVLHSAKAAG